MVNEIDYGEEGEYQKEQKFSIKEIILRHIRKIRDLCCIEFTGGYWEKKPMKTATGIIFSEVYKMDVREAYCNAIDFLSDVIYPMGDDKLKTYLKENEGYDETKIETKEIDIKDKIKLKRRTFRQINLMFERTNFWQGIEDYNE